MQRKSDKSIQFLFLFMVGMFLLSGCAASDKHLREADQAALDIIDQKQKELFGKSEDISIIPPSQTLRYRLFTGQNLPPSHPASLGSRYLKPIPKWPNITYPDNVDTVNYHPKPWNNDTPLKITLSEALQIGAKNSRDYQSGKEDIFLTALDLDLERHEFRSTLTGLLENMYKTDKSGLDTISGVENSAIGGFSRKLKSGLELTTRIGIDLVNLLTLDHASSYGVFADASITIPLLRGAGKHIVAEPLTQAERDVVYAIYRLERFKQSFAVQVASNYLFVLQQLDEIANAEENYKNLKISSIRARKLATAGRMPEVQVDQTIQDALRSWDRLLSAQQTYGRLLDDFKLLLGLPPDANIELDKSEIDRLAQVDVKDDKDKLHQNSVALGGDELNDHELTALLPEVSADQYMITEEEAIRLALDNRLDLRISQGQVYDQQRAVLVAADAIRAEATLLGTGTAGENRSIESADQPSGKLRPDRGTYSALLSIDLPFERTAERNNLRISLIDLEVAIRNLQEAEDQVKLSIRNRLRDLVEFRQRIRIQTKSVEVAMRRVDSTTILLQSGRVQTRDLLEAQEDLLQARNSLIAAQVNYRVAELELQRDLGVLKVTTDGLYQEYRLDENNDIGND